uniref:NADH dehydrogenase subunit 4 n=1 Tax=Tetrapedia diversipes TaxID=889126 RepID=UPI001EFA04EE|nr:NADH dehydrogenase subunit 4 [Tetrapedia diversipes]UKG21061.1 NADH dehydrogenase subunit 4 [Tetrapedia diversipes]
MFIIIYFLFYFHNILSIMFYIMKMSMNMNIIINYSCNLLFLLSFMLLYYSSWVDWWFMFLEYGINYYNMSLMILLFWVSSLIFLTLQKLNYLLMLILSVVMFMNFMSMNFLLFYFWFEIGVLLIFMILMFFGISFDRIMASFYLLFYTMFFSLPLLLILLLINKFMFLDFYLLELFNFKINNFLLIFMILSFMVKIPIYLFHGWLLKAHVEAPYYASMILASMMLKLGGYGLLRLLMIFNMGNLKFYFMVISILGMLILSMLCLLQIDMKVLVAMSSVVHMGLMILSFMVFKEINLIGCVLIMIGHGLVSSGLFYLINMVYKLSHSRLFILNKGLIMSMPSVSLLWFLMCSSNMSAPVSLNLISEIFMFLGLVSWLFILLFILIIYCLMSFIYSVYLFSFLNHGFSNFVNLNFINGKLLDFFLIFMHWIPLNLLILNLNLIC